MKVILEVGPRNEELIQKVQEAKLKGEGIIWEIGEPSSELYDAMYYACECGDLMLEDQTRYLQRLLIEEEHTYYEERMLMDINHRSSMEYLRTELEKNEQASWELWGVQPKACSEHPILFAIARHEDGWEYYYMNTTTGAAEYGIYDDPDATAYEATCSLLESFGFFLSNVGKRLDYETVVSQYEAQTK